MSYEAINSVLKHSQSKGSARLLFLCIAHHANEIGLGARPSVEALAREAKFNRRQTQKWLSQLCQMGELKVQTGGGRKSNEYSILLPFGDATRVPVDAAQASAAQSNAAPVSTQAPQQCSEERPNICMMNVNDETSCMVSDDVSFVINHDSEAAVAAAATALLSHGVDERMAQRLASEDAAECLRQIGALPERGQVRNVPALLVRAIQQKWKLPAPKATQQPQQPHNGIAMSTYAPQIAPSGTAPPRATPPQGTIELSHDPKRAAIEREDRENAALDAQFAAMPEAERDGLRATAQQRLSLLPFLRSEAALRAMIRTLMRESREKK